MGLNSDNRNDSLSPPSDFRLSKDAPFGSRPADIVPGNVAIGSGEAVASADHAHNLTLLETPGVPTDLYLYLVAGFDADTINAGRYLVYDTTNNRLYYRRADGTWKYGAFV